MKKEAIRELSMIVIGIIMVIISIKIRPDKNTLISIAGINNSNIADVLLLVGIILVGYPIFLGRASIF